MRERFDRRSRDPALARQFVALLPPEPHLMDLAAGAGSQFRFLAPMIRRTQHWVFVDKDDDLLQQGLQQTTRWAARHGWRVRRAGNDRGSERSGLIGLGIDTPDGTWTIETMAANLHGPLAMLPLGAVDAVTTNAWLDLVSEAWLAELLGATLRQPLYATITTDGHDALRPQRLREDAPVWFAYREHQVGDKGFGDALGPLAALAAEQFCAALDRPSFTAHSDWRISRQEGAMLHAMLNFLTDAAREACPLLCRRINAWEAKRRDEIAARRLAMTIGHSDILVLPMRGPPHAAGRDRRRLHRRD